MKEPDFECKLPRYDELPNMGLYLEQVVRYVNDRLAVLDVSVTTFMISNYVKKGYIDRPVRKLYYREQIAYIMFISVAKQALSMENLISLIELQKTTYELETAYNYYCTEMESMLKAIFETDDRTNETPEELPFAKKTLRSLVVALAHIFYLNYHFRKADLKPVGEEVK